MQIYTFYKNYRQEIIDTFKLSYPVIIGQLGNVMMGFLDTLMVGNLGYVYLSASSLSNSIYFILGIFGIGMMSIISPLVSEAAAAKNPNLCANYLKQGVWISLITGGILGLLISSCSFLLPYMNQPAEDVALSRSYLVIIGVSILPNLLFLALKHFADGLEATKIGMYATLAGLAINVLGNWLLIYGIGIFPRLELDGAGYATLLSRLLMAAVVAYYIFRTASFKTYVSAIDWRQYDRAVSRRILTLGVPAGLQWVFEAGAFGGAAVMIGWIGSVERAAHQAAIQLATVSFMIVTGIAAGASIRVGTGLGTGNWLNVRKAGFAGLISGAMIMVVSALLFIVFRDYLPAIFTQEPVVLRTASQLMLFAAFFQVFDGVQAVGVAILRGIQDTRIPTLITFFAYFGILLPVGYILSFWAGQGVYGMWYGFVLGLGFACILLTLRFQHLTSQGIKRSITNTFR